MKIWKKIVDFLSDEKVPDTEYIPDVKPTPNVDLWTEKLSNHPYNVYRIKDDEVDSFMQGVVECFGGWHNAPKSVAVMAACCSVMQHSHNSDDVKWALHNCLSTKSEEPFMWRGKTFVLDRLVYDKCNMAY